MLDQHLHLGFRLDGRPIFGFSGGAPDGDGDGVGDGGDPGGDGSQPDATTIGPDGLTAAGRQAIASERAAAKAAKGEARPWKAVGAEFGFTTPEQIREALSKAAATTQQPPVDADKIRREAETEAMTKANRRVAKAEVKALAALTFADPEDAVSALGDEDVDDLLNRNGELDSNSAKAALADILSRKPHWAKKTEEKPPNYDGGPRSNSGGGQQTAGDFFRDQVRAKRGH